MREIFYIASLISFCFVLTPCIAQEKDSVARPYIKTFNDYFYIGPVIKQRDLRFTMNSKSDEIGRLSFKPNNSYSIGVSMNVFDLGLEASLSIPLDIKSINRYGESTVRDFQLSAISKSFLADVYWQKYSGFYYSHGSLKLSSNESFPQRSDIDTHNFGASFAYVFNHSKFSMRSAYTFLDQQLRSKGSPLLGFIVSSFNINGDSSLISRGLRPNNPAANVYAVSFSSLGLAPGYSYNLVVKNFFLNGTLIFGPAHYWIKYHLEEGETHDDIEINTYSSIRIGFGYNGNRLFSGISFSSQSRNVTFQQIEFTNSINTFRFVFGYRFRESGILRKSAIGHVSSMVKRQLQ
jgi:Domain of unknown function (DUF4421)